MGRKSFKATIFTVFLSLRRDALWCRVGLKVYWRIIESYSSKHPANCSGHQVTRTIGTAITATSSCCVAWLG